MAVEVAVEDEDTEVGGHTAADTEVVADTRRGIAAEDLEATIHTVNIEPTNILPTKGIFSFFLF